MDNHFLGFVRDRDDLFAFGARPLFARELVAYVKSSKTAWAGDLDWHGDPKMMSVRNRKFLL
jgi:hypothetical protein